VIASRLSLTPETLSRIFHELSDAGLISVQGKHIVIHDAQSSPNTTERLSTLTDEYRPALKGLTRWVTA
jgi:DNA-binding transcriptional regulator YhcF (GntR family)